MTKQQWIYLFVIGGCLSDLSSIQSTIPVVYFSKKCYSNCSVLVGSRNGAEVFLLHRNKINKCRDIQLKQARIQVTTQY